MDHLSVFGLEPVSFIHLVRELGLSAVGLNMNGAANPLDQPCDIGFRNSPERRRAITRALRDCGVTLAMVEGFTIAAERSAAGITRDLDHLAEMDASMVCFVTLDKDKSRTHVQFRQLAERAAERNIVITTELGAGAARNLHAALDLIASVDHCNFGLTIDTMHFFRSGATVEDFAALDPALVRHVQLCDVPIPAVMPSYMEEALFERRAPGDGDLPLAAFLRHIPAHATIGLEIPIRSQAAQGMSHYQRLERCINQARALCRTDRRNFQ